ncbi:hypothetical protein CYMTET_14261 [Cymbomonas tetramitiformis]|uniref:L-ornithine N(5)-monooxygenase [NAD(P)H] n=1 Tax=Cymbomonas tetramitiformis TaxID=36881 RepID=A0AAE0GGD0_9CHLO|nr:hypothetical protein CYMTET_14261 [Cymbomonas tetramitiformis]
MGKSKNNKKPMHPENGWTEEASMSAAGVREDETYDQNEEAPDSHIYDVCIVGAGPHGLSVLSALHSQDAALTEAQRKIRRPKNSRAGKSLSVCVVDVSGVWLSNWNRNFTALDIKWLRSPLLAHPDANDAAALLEYAEREQRLDEIREVDLSCSCLAGQVDLEVGLYSLPSSALFYDFCQELSTKLTHDFVSGRVDSVDRDSNGSSYTITFTNDVPALRSRQIVYARGVVGGPQIPLPFCTSFDDRKNILHTTECDRFEEIVEDDTVLVIGGGLSAAQAALLAVSKGAKETILCSRRPLTTRQFDVPLNWVNPRENRGCRYEFFGLPDEEKTKWVSKVRGGGSIPKDYMHRLVAAEQAGRLKLVVGEVESCEVVPTGGLCVKSSGQSIYTTRVVLATGSTPHGVSDSLCTSLAKKFSLPMEGGYPVLSDGLQWGSENFYVTGALALLRLGPDASNLMGARRGAQLCASELGTFEELHNQGSVFSNRYNALMIDSEC